MEEAPQLPSLPRHARYVHHNNSCYDWGTYGWALEAEIVDTSVYAYIVLINSSVRGPFLPPYWPVRTRLLCTDSKPCLPSVWISETRHPNLRPGERM